METRGERLMWVSLEPWETLVGNRFLNLAQKRLNISSTSLLVADVTQAEHPVFRKRLSKMTSEQQHRIYIVFENHVAWSKEIASGTSEIYVQNVKEIERYYAFDLDAALATDPMFTPHERRPYFCSFSPS